MENPNVLKEWFHRVDSNNTGSINASQLKNALAVGNLNIPLSVVQQMIRMYDFDRNGTMDFQEFVALNKFLLKVQNAFCQLDRGNGFLKPEDVYQALVKLGFSLDSPAFFTVCELLEESVVISGAKQSLSSIQLTHSCQLSQVLKSFDQNKVGMVRLDAFISLCIFVQSAQNLFNSFDTTKQGRVTLDFNQFVYCTANCRI